jgi:RNA polymerase sigma factor (TIGR02999 family)
MSTPDSLPPGMVTQLLRKAKDGCEESRDELFRVTFERLKAIATNQIRRWGATDARGATSLVQDAVLDLLERQKLDAENRRHFFFIMKRAMKDVLREQFRLNDAVKNGRDWKRMPMIELAGLEGAQEVTAEELGDALDALEARDPDASHAYVLIEMYGSTLQGAAEALGRTFSQVRDDRDYAGSWLKRHLSRRRP